MPASGSAISSLPSGPRRRHVASTDVMHATEQGGRRRQRHVALRPRRVGRDGDVASDVREPLHDLLDRRRSADWRPGALHRAESGGTRGPSACPRSPVAARDRHRAARLQRLRSHRRALRCRPRLGGYRPVTVAEARTHIPRTPTTGGSSVCSPTSRHRPTRPERHHRTTHHRRRSRGDADRHFIAAAMISEFAALSCDVARSMCRRGERCRLVGGGEVADVFVPFGAGEVASGELACAFDPAGGSRSPTAKPGRRRRRPAVRRPGWPQRWMVR